MSDRLFHAIKAPPKTEAYFLEVLRGCSEAEVKYRSDEGWTVLWEMARENDWPEAVAALIRRGCDIHAVDGVGDTPLHWAGRHNHRETARVLLEHGADRTLKNNGAWTAADQARDQGNNDLAAYIDGALASPCALPRPLR